MEDEKKSSLLKRKRPSNESPCLHCTMNRDGYVVLKGLLSQDQLSFFQQESTSLIQSFSSDYLINQGFVVEALSIGDYPEDSSVRVNEKDYLLKRCKNFKPETMRKDIPLLRDWLFGSKTKDLLTSISKCTHSKSQTLPFYLFNEQYIIKPVSKKRTAFSVHRDYVEQFKLFHNQSGSELFQLFKNGKLKPVCRYVSLWIPLNPVDETNGTLFVKPWNKKEYQEMKLSPGDCVIMDCWVSHYSSNNHSKTPRSALYCQYLIGNDVPNVALKIKM